jgi:ELWxxDGT repeat protein
MDINPGAASSNPFDFTRTGNLVFFAADDGVHGQEAWRSDGTAAGTFMVGGPIRDQPYQGYSNRFVAAGNLVFFNDRDNDPLWVSDGTVAGTHQVLGGPSGNDPQFANFITPSGSAIYYESADQSLWRSDGTVAGTYQVSSVNYYAGLGTVNGLFIFLGDTDGRHSTELWATDGTSGGTVLLQHIATGSSNLFVRIEPQPYITWGSNVYVSVFGPIDIEPGAKGLGFWKTDGTPAGTSELSSAVVGSLFAYGQQIFLANGRLLFAATDTDNSTQLWSSNGTSSGRPS